MQKKRWVYKGYDEKVAEQLQQELKIHPVFCRLLVQRGITTFEEARSFFRPSLDQLHDPFLMTDMDKAIHRINRAVADKEKILIYGDYDVDGTTAVALTYSFFAEFYFGIDFYIPDRYNEGYGISNKGIDWAAEHGFTLIIALDCGIKSVDKIAYAKSKGIDFIICDHHLPGDEIPDAVAVLDPKRKDCTYPYKELSGAGIGFKLIQAFAKDNGLDSNSVYKYLDMVAISIGADIVPITGENRILAFYGLKKINASPGKGVKSLMNIAGLVKKDVNITDVVFVLAPRINAAGRISDAENAVKLLIGDKSIDYAQLLNDLNDERKTYDLTTTTEAFAYLKNDEDYVNRKSTVLFNPDWHKGIVGIVASRLTDVHYKPTIVMTESNGVVSGSARSIKGFDIHAAILHCQDLLITFGGHPFAAGLTMKPENIEAFKARFEEFVSANVTDDMMVPEIEIDADLELSDVNYSFHKILNQFAPFGPGNMKPVFCARNLKELGESQIVKQDHLRLRVQCIQGRTHKGMAFKLAYQLDHIQNQNIDICYCVEENEWQGQRSIEIYIKDIRLHSDEAGYKEGRTLTAGSGFSANQQ